MKQHRYVRRSRFRQSLKRCHVAAAVNLMSSCVSGHGHHLAHGPMCMHAHRDHAASSRFFSPVFAFCAGLSLG